MSVLPNPPFPIRDTPRTDYMVDCCGLYDDDAEIILCRELERELAAALDALLEYGQHKTDCSYLDNPAKDKCDCGYWQALYTTAKEEK